MRTYILVVKRLIVLALGILFAWFTVFTFFPLVDDRLPLVLALLLTYSFVAYLGLPAILRIWQAVHRPNHVPTRTVAADGWAVDPINIVVLAKNEKEFIWAMEKAGWILADPRNPRNSIRLLVAMLLNRPYLSAPFGTYYVFGRRQDLGFQIPVGNSPRHRHHVRFWRLGATLLDDEHEHRSFWQRLLRKFVTKEKEVWVGAAVLDKGINIRVRNLQLDHAIESDTTLEREFLVDSLKEAHVLRDVTEIKAGEPLHAPHQGFRETIISDGYVKLCELKRQFLPPISSHEE